MPQLLYACRATLCLKIDVVVAFRSTLFLSLFGLDNGANQSPSPRFGMQPKVPNGLDSFKRYRYTPDHLARFLAHS